MGVGFVRFLDKFGGVGAPFFGCVAVSSHKSEQEVEEVMCPFWKVFEDFIWDCGWSTDFTGRRLVACGRVMFFVR